MHKLRLSVIVAISVVLVLILAFLFYNAYQKPQARYSLGGEYQGTQNFERTDTAQQQNEISTNAEGCEQLDSIIDNLVIFQPPMSDIERCFSGTVRRNPTPRKFYSFILPSSIYGRDAKNTLRYFENLERYQNKFGFYGISPGLSDAVAPPYVYDNTPNVLRPPYIETPQYFERKMSAYIAMYLKEKQTYGYSFIFTTMYPPTDWSQSYQNINSKEDFQKFWQDVFVKEAVERAKLAEKWGFEFFSPLPLELERILTPLDKEFLKDLSSEEIEQLGQWAIDTVADAVRPYFQGKLILSRYPFTILPSLEKPKEPTWENLDMSKYDLVGFSLIPECSTEKSKIFASQQIQYYERLAQKQGKPWGFNEIDVRARDYERCGENIENIEEPVWREIIAILDSLEYKPSFVAFGLRTDVGQPQNPTELNSKAFPIILDYIKRNYEAPGI